MVDAGGRGPDKPDIGTVEKPVVDPRHRPHQQNLRVSQPVAGQASAGRQLDFSEFGKRGSRVRDIAVSDDAQLSVS
jgi:hypothetical protein